MSPNIFENAAPYFPEKNKEETVSGINEKVEQLKPQIDYTEKMLTWKENFQKIEQSQFDGEFDFFDKELGVSAIGDKKNSFVVIEIFSPLFAALESELLGLKYNRKEGTNKTVFSKIIER